MSIGHFVNSLLNSGNDTPEDEGELFAATILNTPLSEADRLRINQENDQILLFVNDQWIPVEQSSTLPTITVATTDSSAGETKTVVTPNLGRFTLTRTGSTTKALTVNYTLTGTATKGTDYTNLTGTVTFAVGSSTDLVNVNPLDDTLAEGNETAILTLATGTGYTLGTTKTGTVTIADNDPFPVITVTAPDANAGETITGETANPGWFTLTRTGD